MSDLFSAPRWTNAELAEVFRISAQRLGVLCKQGVVPLPTDGMHEPKKSVAAYVQHLKKKEEGATQASESIRKIQLENELRSMKLKRIAGELVPVDRIQKEWFEITRRVRDGLLNLPSRLSGVFAAELSQEKIFELFTKEVHATLTELSNWQASPQHALLLPLEEEPSAATPPADQAADGPVERRPDPELREAATETEHTSSSPGDRFSTGD